jgi:hypothetical protein
MSKEAERSTTIYLVRMDDGRWRVFIDDADMGEAFQFPWDALQCALNGSLTGKPISDLQAIEVRATTEMDKQRLARVRAAQAERRALLAALRGIDGEGI